MRTLGTGLVLALLPVLAWAGSATLTYQGTNQWVAEADNTPLRQVLKAAKQGQQRFQVVLPKADRALAEKRAQVVLDLLTKQRNQPITLMEASGKTPVNTLRISW